MLLETKAILDLMDNTHCTCKRIEFITSKIKYTEDLFKKEGRDIAELNKLFIIHFELTAALRFELSKISGSFKVML